ncbi:fungal-specific transcription factor domain-containing protein [Radiomyces spectabilis]|uniref:fungal-specific transcription factor domain-containing protein n=1 Tax=Radiomyces spectabilis TaxID=64574 RepID=UPI00221EA572|nr:fungal-specific transcription factor domain-containing protein [Radiomyces spectabilis]KAI8381173.1 fungal-specific transcription factor domain-containing protein [Radiomyces spectabilis]
MSSVFVPDNSGSASPQKSPESSRPKRPRSSLACIRCRKKKVKCDFVQPTCGRCAMAGLPCSYATPPRRVDGQAFDKLGNHVEELKERMQKMQSELAKMKDNLHPFSGSIGYRAEDDQTASGPSTPYAMPSQAAPTDMFPAREPMAVAESSSSQHLLHHSASQQPVTWKLSLSPSGLRIDTNIASVADLYRILLNGISQLNINADSATSLFSTDTIRGEGRRNRQARGLRNAQRNNALESGDGMFSATATDPTTTTIATSAGPSTSTSTSNTTMNHGQSAGGGRLWEVDDNEARKIIQENTKSDDSLPPDILQGLLRNCYHRCFLAYQIVDKETFVKQCTDGLEYESLLANSVSAWVSKHGCIYHNAAPGQNPTTMGEAYFMNARQLLKKCFDISSPTTIHALLNLYMYQLNSERSSLAYLYIGLAIRMAQDLKFHKKEHMPADPKQRETNKRLWWSAYWLDLCAALESNRPTMVDDKDCDLEYPVKLDSEDEETGYQIDFCVHSIKLMKIRKDITKHLPSEQSGQSLLSAISRLENALTNWLNELPQSLRFDPDDKVFRTTGSFRDEACLILNIQYQTTWIMLHEFFLPKQDQTATPVALLSLNICTKSANFISKMLDIYSKNLCWCQFFYVIDGVIASVAIHQVNALSNEKEVASLAQRNLIVTADVLKGSPLMYMEKINEIVDSIEGFLKKHELPMDVNNLPPVNEDSVNQQSISSVFHPAMLDTHPMTPQNSTLNNFGLPSFGQGTPLSQSRPDPDSPSMATNASRFGSVGSIPMNSPRSQTPGSVPHTTMPTSQMSPHTSMFTPQPGSAQDLSSLSSPIPMSSSSSSSNQRPGSEAKMREAPTHPQAPPHQQHQQQPQPQPQFSRPTSQSVPFVTASNLSNNFGLGNMLFNDPAFMNFNIPNTSQDMDQALFRDMGFSNLGGGDSRMNSEDQLNQSNMFASLDSSLFGERNAYTSASNPAAGTSFNFAEMGQGSMYGQQGATNESMGYPNYLGDPELFGLSTSSSMLPTSSQTQASNMMDPQYPLNGSVSGTSVPSTMMDSVESTQPMDNDQAFDPRSLFGNMNIDPATMNAFLQMNAASGYSPFYGQQQAAPGQASSSRFAGSNAMTEAMFAASRKRPHREWDDSA